LRTENVSDESIFCTGNTVIDALLWVRDRVRGATASLPTGVLDAIEGRTLVLVTGHRRESFGQGFENICTAIRELADMFDDLVFVYPVHLNPRVVGPVTQRLGGHERILLIEPLAYEPFVWLMDKATVILTDSGGVQEEAPSLGKPVLVMRATTERPEGVEAGNARLVGTDPRVIVDSLVSLLVDADERARMGGVANPYGDGKAAQRIADIVISSLAEKGA
jgi:UDP-N-acetylglucosamine 2-epimerase